MFEIHEQDEEVCWPGGESHGIHGSRFRECLDSPCPDEEELSATGALTDPFEADRLRLAGLSESHINLIMASKSAPPTPSDAEDFRWHGSSGSEGNGGTSPVSSFLPKLVRRLSGRVASSSSSTDSGGNRLRKRRAPPSPSAQYSQLPPLSPPLADRGSNLFRSITREDSGIISNKFQRPVNPRSFSLPLLMLPKRQKGPTDRLTKQSSESSGHEADVSQDSMQDENENRRRSFEVVSRPPKEKKVPVALDLINEVPAKVSRSSPRSAMPRSRVNSSPPRPSVTEIFDISPIQDDLIRRRHSVTSTPALSPHRRDPNSASSLDTLLSTPSPTKTKRDSSPLLPLAAAASTPSLSYSGTSFCEIDRRTPHFSQQSQGGKGGGGKEDVFDTYGLRAGKIRVYGEEYMLTGVSL